MSQITGIEHARTYRAGEVIFEEGQPGECMYLVLAGQVEVSIQGRQINTVEPGSIFGEMALVDAGARSATVKALVDSRLVPIDRDRFARLVKQSPEFALQVMGTMSTRLRNLLDEEIKKQVLEEELKIGREIQLSLLPTADPQIEGWEFASFYRAAREVGGDLFDFIQMPDDSNNLSVVIADVTGKGVPAALFMAFGRTAIRAEVLNGRSPAEALYRTNRMILMDTQSPLLMSAFLGSFNLHTGHMTFACAGHDRPLWVKGADSSVSSVDAKGIVLGVFEQVFIEESAIDVGSGDFVIFYTDGVTEARDEDFELFGLDRLLQVVSGTRCVSAREMVDTIIQAVEAFVGDTPQADDLTLVVARRL